MKKIILTILLISQSAVFGQMQIQLPNNQVNPNEATPFIIYLTEPYQTDFSISIKYDDEEKILEVNNKTSKKIQQISSRFKPIKSKVIFSLRRSETIIQEEIRILNIDKAAIIPEDRISVAYTLSNNRIIELKKDGVDYLSNIQQGKASFFIKNATSKKSYLKSITFDIDNTESTDHLKVFGSPYWHEPIIIFEGNFTLMKIINMETNEK